MSSFHGLLVIDKPSGITSREAVDRVQTWFPRGTRVGHTGTLDPLANGVLVVCIGAATRLTEYVQAMTKVYHACITLGATSDTDDADGTITPCAGPTPPTRAQIEQTLGSFVGAIEQIPPAFSAAKIAGRRAYALARKGRDVQLEPRTIRIDRIELQSFEYPRLEIVVQCGKGTYIRSLARDLGKKLGCGGYITSLRRTSVGWFMEADAISLEIDAAAARTQLLPVWRAVQAQPPIKLSDSDARKLLQGQRIAIPADAVSAKNDLVVMDDAGRLLAVVFFDEGWLRPRKVLALD